MVSGVFPSSPPVHASFYFVQILFLSFSHSSAFCGRRFSSYFGILNFGMNIPGTLLQFSLFIISFTVVCCCYFAVERSLRFLWAIIASGCRFRAPTRSRSLACFLRIMALFYWSSLHFFSRGVLIKLSFDVI